RSLGTSTLADIEQVNGPPGRQVQGSFETSRYPPYSALGYDCAQTQDSQHRSLTYYPSAPYCATIYYVNSQTHALQAFRTSSPKFQTTDGVRPGMSVSAAERIKGGPPQAGCGREWSAGGPGFPATLVIDASAPGNG